MELKNGKLGVKRIYTAELLQLFAAIVGVVAAILGIVAVALTAVENGEGAAIGLGAGAGALGIVAGVLGIVGFILYLVGVGTAAKDSAFFKTALTFIVIGIVASIFNTIFDGINAAWAGYVASAFELIKSVTELLTVLYIVDGIIDFAKQIGDEAVQQKGNVFKWLLVIVYGLASLLVLIGIICGATVASAIAVSAIGIVTAVLSVVKYFVYLALLAKAKNMAWDNVRPAPSDNVTLE